MDRIQKLCAYLERCKTFADVGCDHGYCTRYMLDNGLCEKAIISDISDKCLNKAETLLQEYIKKGKCIPVCCSGLEKIDPLTELVLIAGMGGEEIISILKSSFIPENFVVQPMRNVREVREFLLENGAEITRDEIFSSGGKFYFVICGSRRAGKSAENSNTYTTAQLEYGKGDLDGDLGAYLCEELQKKRSYLERDLSAGSRKRILESIKFTEGVLKGEIR